MLRSNLFDEDPAKLWEFYNLLTQLHLTLLEQPPPKITASGTLAS